MDVVHPVDQVEEGKGDGEDDAGPLVYGVDIRQVWDLDFELRRPPPQTTLLVADRPVEGRSTIQVSAGHGLAVLYAGAVVGEHGGPRVVESPYHLGPGHPGHATHPTHLVTDLQICQEDVAVGVHLHFVTLQTALVFVIGFSCFLRHLFLQVRPPTEEDVVNERVLQQGQEDKHEAAHQVDVYSLDIGDFG